MTLIEKLRQLKRLSLQLKYHRSNKIGSFVNIAKDVMVDDSELKDYSRIAKGASVHDSYVGEYSAIGRYTKVSKTEIGRFCAISWDCTINALSHPHENLTISAFPYVPYVGGFVNNRSQSYKKTIIGNDVWIGANSVIMPGIIIGDGAVIGAGSVVTKNVQEYAIVAGVPAKFIKYRFSEEFISRLLAVKWWMFDRDIIKNNINLFQGALNEEVLINLERLRK